jgi:magnesium transporter
MPEKSSRQSIDDLQAALAANDSQAIVDFFNAAESVEAVHAISHLSDDEQSRLLTSLSREDAASLVDDLPEEQAAQMIERLSVGDAAAIVSQKQSNEQADVIARLPGLEASAILDAMPPAYSRSARRLMSYPPDSAGGLMITEYLSYGQHLTVGDVLDDLRTHADQYRHYDVQYAYVIADSGKLVGVLRLRDLLLSAPDQALSTTMIGPPLAVPDTARLEILERFFDRHALFGVPAIDADGRLVGVVRNADVEQAAAERSSRSFLKFMGIVGGEEFRSMPLRIRSMRRLSWLSVNILLNILAASVIAVNQDTLAAVIALAVFLPIISDMSGCSGNQAVAVTMRELALGFIDPTDVGRVLGKEAAVGIINGIALGLLLGFVGWIWQGNFMLGAVVAAALAINTLVAVCFGGSVPLLLKALGQDPALASGPILTTVTDMSGFFLVLTLAKSVLPYLTSQA